MRTIQLTDAELALLRDAVRMAEESANVSGGDAFSAYFTDVKEVEDAIESLQAKLEAR